MSYDYVRDVVGRYTDAVLLFNEVEATNNRMRSLISPIDGNLKISFGAFSTDCNYRSSRTDRGTFKKELQKSAWLAVFKVFKMDKYVTSGVMADINKFVEQQTHVPFSMKNVYKMAQMIVGTNESRMNQVLVEAFEKICSFSSENSTAGEKWKTNSDYVINKKFILPCIVKIGWHGEVSLSYYSNERMADIIKALCFLTGTKYEDATGLDTFVSKMDMTFGKWYEWGFFSIKAFKKGTMHFQFSDEKVLEQFNRRVAEIKGWRLPKSTTKAYRAKKEGVVLF